MCHTCSKHVKMENTVYGIKNKNQDLEVGKKTMPISVFTERAFECEERNRVLRRMIRCHKLSQTQQ